MALILPHAVCIGAHQFLLVVRPHGKEVAGDAKRKMDAGAAAAAERIELSVARAAKRAANSKRPLYT